MKQLCHIFLMVFLLALMLPAKAAITVLTGSVKNQTGNGKLSLTPNAGSQPPDLLLAQIIAKSGAAITAPGGWVNIPGASANSGGIQQQIYYLPSGSGDGSQTHQFDVNGTTASNNGVIFSVRSASTTSPICGTGLQPGGGNQITAPNVQTQPPTCPAGSLRLAFFAVNDGSINAYPVLVTSDSSTGTATAGPSNQAGANATGVGLYSSYYLLKADSNGSSIGASLDVNANANSIGASLIINAGPAEIIDHVQLDLAGTPLTCNPLSAAVKVCANAACSTLVSTSTAVTLTSTAGSWFGSNPKTFTGSTTTSLSVPAAVTTTLGASSSPAASKATTCFLNGVQIASCQISFADTGLLLMVPAQSSGVTSSGSTTFSVAAVRKSDDSAVCTPAFASASRNIDFWANYTSPASGTMALAVNGMTVPMNAVSTGASTSTTGTALSLNFDATGTASGLTLKYMDAGQLTLNARYDGSVANNDNGLVVTGTTAFATVPYSLCLDSPDSNWSCAVSPALAQTPTNCSVFKTAGSSFNLRLTGKAYQAGTANCSLPTTPNYVQSNIPLSLVLVAPSGGTGGNLGTSTISVASAGTVTMSDTISDVGVFTLAATPQTSAYFGQTVPSANANFGRFIPAGFAISGTSLINRADLTCSPASAFTYLEEPVRLALTLSAVNSSGSTTQNYIGNYARLNLAPVVALGSNGLAFGAQSGATLLNPNATTSLSRLGASCVSCGPFSAGVAAIAADVTIKRASGSSRDGPYTPATFGLAVTDSDSVVAQSPNYNWDGVGSSEGTRIGQTNLYFGRMRLESAYGSSLLDLRVPAYAQYWNGTSFVKNALDSCTRLTVPASILMNTTTTTSLFCNGGVGLYGNLSGVSASMNGTAANGIATLVAGDAVLKLAKPTNAAGGYLDLALAVPDYLKYEYDLVDQTTATCTNATPTADGYLHDDNPRARVRFGVRRNDGVIYLREVY